jgi:uncharacterized protein
MASSTTITGRLSRRLFFATPLAVAALAHAWAQDADIKFEHSSLVIDTGGRELKFQVELALNDSQRARGLMFREKLGPYEGMLFDFMQEQPVSFWMKNTLIPLDMLFIGADGTVLDIHERAVPLSLDSIGTDKPVLGVLELNGGTVSRLGIKRGDRVEHPLFAKGG